MRVDWSLRHRHRCIAAICCCIRAYRPILFEIIFSSNQLRDYFISIIQVPNTTIETFFFYFFKKLFLVLYQGRNAKKISWWWSCWPKCKDELASTKSFRWELEYGWWSSASRFVSMDPESSGFVRNLRFRDTSMILFIIIFIIFLLVIIIEILLSLFFWGVCVQLLIRKHIKELQRL